MLPVKRLHDKLPTIAIDTVYRTLATFDELGLVKKLHIMNERPLFDTNLNLHHHFICTRCKKVEDIYWPDFDKTMNRVSNNHLIFRTGVPCASKLVEAELQW